MRECKHCKGTDDALLSRRLDNEKTILLTQWFNCVKLPNHVLQQNHPFRNLFVAKHPPHLFLCRFDGTAVVDMDGQQTQSDLWKAMTKLIRLEYRGDPQKALKEIFRCLNAYDSIDSRELELRDRYEDALDRHGPKSSKVKKLQKKLEKLVAERKTVEAREQELMEFDLRPLPETAGDGG